MKIVLCGYMGSGKTVIGKLIAKHLGIEFYDLDERIADQAGMSITAIFEEKGEIYFRKLEHACLLESLSAPKNRVISLGGGTPCYGTNLELIKSADTFLVYLKMELGDLVNRLFEEKSNRPMISHYSEKKELEEFVRKHLFERNHFYLQSDLILEVGKKTAKECANEIMNVLD